MDIVTWTDMCVCVCAYVFRSTCKKLKYSVCVFVRMWCVYTMYMCVYSILRSLF